MPNYIDMSMTGVIHEYEIFGGRPPESKNDERSESENDCSRTCGLERSIVAEKAAAKNPS